MPNTNVSIGICWYSVMSAWRKGEMPIGRLFEFAKEIGADGVEILDAFLYEPGVVRDHLPSQAAIDDCVLGAASAMQKTGLKVHGIGVTNDFNHDDGNRLVLEREKIKLGVDMAKKLGAPAVRVFAGNPTSSDGVDLVRYRTIDALKDLVDDQVTLALENHGNVFTTPSRLDSILEAMTGKNVGLCFDVGNFILADYNSVDAANELPVPSLIHLKDFRPAETGPYKSSKGIVYEGCRLGEGMVPIRECLKVLLEKVGDHPIAIDLELECGEDGLEASREGVKWLRSLLAES